MKRIGIIVALSVGLAGAMIVPASALSEGAISQLKKLDPQTRLEQRCDIEAMHRLRRETRWQPDKVLAYAFSDPVMTKTSIKAEGAAFRSHGKWYRFSFSCKTASDYLTVTSFDYKTGDIVPRKNWDAHYLVP